MFAGVFFFLFFFILYPDSFQNWSRDSEKLCTYKSYRIDFKMENKLQCDFKVATECHWKLIL